MTIGNFTTQKAFYAIKYEGIEFESFEQINQWLNKWVEETTEDGIKAIENFWKEKRKNIKYKAGDFFCFKIDRIHYGFGRLLFDVHEFTKQKTFDVYKNYGIQLLAGIPLVVKVYHKISTSKKVDIKDLRH